MTQPLVTLTIADGIAHVELTREDAANAINPQLAEDLSAAAQECDTNPAVRAVLFSARGKMFSVGGDLAHMKAQGDDAGRVIRRMADDLHRAISQFSRSQAPMVTAVQGTAAGAGLSLSIMGDIVIAEPQAKFTMAYTNAGLSPDGGSTYLLPRLIGQRRAMEMALTNRVLSADEALEWGLVNQVVEKGAGLDAARAICAKLAAGSKSANGDAKQLMRASLDNSLETHMELEGRAIAKNAVGDGREGIAAFFEKRAPKFS